MSKNDDFCNAFDKRTSYNGNERKLPLKWSLFIFHVFRAEVWAVHMYHI